MIATLAACGNNRQEEVRKALQVQDSIRNALNKVNDELGLQKEALLRQRDSLAKTLESMSADLKKAGGQLSKETDSALKAIRKELKEAH